jgi:thiol-disulfide isomerase/thioredoxin
MRRKTADKGACRGVRNLENLPRDHCLRKLLSYAGRMRNILQLIPLLLAAAGLVAADAPALLPVEQQVAEAVKSSKVTVVHLWATWCPNCHAELRSGGWSAFIEANPEVNFIFVTVRDDKPGLPELAKFGIGPQKNFTHRQHPNPSHDPDTEMTSFLGQRVGWIPVTWVFRDGKLRYALNYGQIRFPILQQLVEDAQPKW